jgi:hypothetical protein
VVPVAARTRRENKTLKSAASRRVSPRGDVGPVGNARRVWAPRGVPIAVEEKSLKGEAHGRSDAKASGGPVVDVAQGVAKPRTRYAVAEGSAAERICRPGIVS